VKYRHGQDRQGVVTFDPCLEARRLFRRAKIFTTGMAAKACRVAPRTVSKWFDAGKIGGYKLPGAEDRRIPRAELIRFMKAHGIPLDVLGGDGPAYAALLSGCAGPWADRFAACLDAAWHVDRAASLFDAAGLVADREPDAVILDLSLGRAECADAARRIRRRLYDALIVGLLPEDAGEADAGYDLTASAGGDPAAVARLLLERSAA
jgi:two-component system response regulator RpaA